MRALRFIGKIEREIRSLEAYRAGAMATVERLWTAEEIAAARKLSAAPPAVTSDKTGPKRSIPEDGPTGPEGDKAAILSKMKENKGVEFSAQHYSEVLYIPRPRTDRAIRALKDEGKITDNGKSGKGRAYRYVKG